jgi:hypothetical protein
MVGPATLPELAAAIDPQGPHVLLSAHAPTAGSTWTEWLLPLTADVAVEPRRLRVANLSYDVLFNTQDFLQAVDQLDLQAVDQLDLQAVDQLDQFGVHVLQFTRLPRADVSFEDPRPAVRATRYRAFGLRIGIDLPHRNEVANVVTLDDPSLDDALIRLGIA